MLPPTEDCVYTIFLFFTFYISLTHSIYLSRIFSLSFAVFYMTHEPFRTAMCTHTHTQHTQSSDKQTI